MARHSNLASTAARVDRMAENLRTSMKAKRDAAFIETADAAARLTPVDTLKARTSWNPGIGGVGSQGADGPRLPSASAQENLRAGKFAETAGRRFTVERTRLLTQQVVKVDGTLVLTNDAEHIIKLNQGGSPQMPAGGFVQIAAIEGRRAAAAVKVVL